MWEGSLDHGYPALNLRMVLRHIYQWERGAIPPGHTLRRTDHTVHCFDVDQCRHGQCVNPWHVEPIPNRRGLYKRARSWDPTRTDHTLHYLNTQRKKGKHDRDRDSQGDDAVRGGGAGEGPGMA